MQKQIMKRIISSIFLILSLVSVHAQSFEEEQVHILTSTPQQSVQNTILDKIAEGESINVTETNLKLVFVKDISLTKDTKNKFLVSVKIELIDQKSKAEYKGFTIQEDLLPASINFALLAGQEHSHLKDFEKITKDGDNAYRVEYTSNIDKLFSELHFSIGDLQLNYNDSDKDRVFKSLNLIDDYYSKSSQIEEFHKLLAEVDFTDPEQIQGNKDKIKEIEVLLSHFEKFPEKLDLEMNDPLDFKNLFDRYKKEYQTFLTAYQEALSQIHALYYQKGMEHQRKGWISSAKADFESSLVHKPNYPPALNQLARVYYLGGDFERTEEYLDLLWEHADKDDSERKSSEALYEDLYYFHKNNATKAANELDFEQALKEYEKAEKICKKDVLEEDCEKDLGEKLKKVRADQFEYTMAVARDQVYSKGFRKAKKALEIALGLIANNPAEFAPQSESIRQVFEELYLLAIDDAKEDIETQTYYAAVESLAFAELLKEKHPNFEYKKGDIKEIYAQTYDGNYKQSIKDAIEMQQIGELLASRNLFIGALGEAKIRKEWIKQPRDEEIMGHLAKLYLEFTTRALKLNESQKYKEAIDDLRIALNLGGRYAFTTQQKAIAKGFYNAYFGLTKRATDKKDFLAAIEYLTVANAQIEEEEFAEKQEFIQKASEERTRLLSLWVKSKIDEAQKNVDANQKNKANTLLEEVRRLLSDYKFTLDKSVKKQYNSIRNAVKK
jgi:hypothetical protein